MLDRPLRIRDAVRVRPLAQRANIRWPGGCARFEIDFFLDVNEVGTIVALITAADLWPDADDIDAVGDVMVAAVLWDDLASQLADDSGDGMPEVATWLIPVDALERVDEDDELRTTIALDVLARVKQLEAERRESSTQRALRSRLVKVLRTIADDIISGRKVARG